jgi:hypothetical protein
MVTRKFNQDAYNGSDNPAKKKAIDVVTANSPYVVYDGLNNELFKECDLKFINYSTNHIFKIENETRVVYDKILTLWKTAHIPNRKRDSSTDRYLIWKSDFSEFLCLDWKKVEKYKETILNLYCRDSYHDEFIDIPIHEFKRYQVLINNKIKELPI